VDTLHKASKIIDKISGFIIFLLFSTMIVTYFGQIVLRYVVGTGFRWTEELTRYVDIWAIMIGAAMIARRRTHINVSVLEEILPTTPKNWLLVVQQLFSLGFFLAMFFIAFDFIEISGSQVTTNMRIPKRYVYAIFPPAFGIFIFQTAVGIVDAIKEARS